MIFVRGNSLTRYVQLQLQEAGRVGVDADGGPGDLAPRWHPMPYLLVMGRWRLCGSVGSLGDDRPSLFRQLVVWWRVILGS